MRKWEWNPQQVVLTGVFSLTLENKMFIKVGDIVKTDFCVGRVLEILDGRVRRWQSDIYYRINVLRPVVHWSRRNQIIKIEEVKAKL
jgi:hypothetical protein